MTTEQQREDITPMLLQIAYEFGGKFRQYGAEGQDFAQELWLWIFDNAGKVSEWLDPELWEPKAGEKMLAKSLRNEATDYGLDIKAQALGYKREDLYFYTKGELKSLLPAVFNEDSWMEPPQSEGRSTKAPSEGGNWIATLADVARAFESLDSYDQGLLRAFHSEGWTNKMMAEANEVSEQLMSYYHDRAIGRLQKALGGQEPHKRPQESRDAWRGRHAVSNASAVAMTQKAYEDG